MKISVKVCNLGRRILKIFSSSVLIDLIQRDLHIIGYFYWYAARSSNTNPKAVSALPVTKQLEYLHCVWVIKTVLLKNSRSYFLSCSHDNFNHLLSQIIKRRIFNGEWKAFLGSLQEGPNYLLTVSIEVIFNPKFSEHPITLSFSLLPLSRSLLPLPPSLLPLPCSLLPLPHFLLPLPCFLSPHPLPSYPFPFPFYSSPFTLIPPFFPFTPFPFPLTPPPFPFTPPPSLLSLPHSPLPLSFPLTPPSFPFTPSPFPLIAPQFPLIPSHFPLTLPQFPLIPSPFHLIPPPFLLPLLSSFIPPPNRFKGDTYVVKNLLFQCASSYNHPQAYLQLNIPTPIPPKSILL